MSEIDDCKVWWSTPKNKIEVFFKSQSKLIDENILKLNEVDGLRFQENELKTGITYFISKLNMQINLEIGVSTSTNGVQRLSNGNIDPYLQISDKSHTIRSEHQFNKIFEVIKINRKNYNQKMKKWIDLSTRQDVVNKSALRQMRKYYSNIFKRANPKLVRLRFCNVKSSEITRAVKKILLEELGSESHPDDLHYYFIGILKIKNLSRMFWDFELKKEVLDFLNWIRDYSGSKFESLFKSKRLRLLCKKFILKNSKSNQTDSLKQILDKNEDSEKIIE